MNFRPALRYAKQTLVSNDNAAIIHRFRSVFDDNLYTLKYRGYTEHPRRNIADFPRGYLRLLLLFRDSREFGSGFEANSRRKSCNESILNALRVTIYSINKDNIYIERERTSKFIILNLI